MKKFQNILFVADKSKGEALALAKILELAADTGARVTVLDVLVQFPDKLFVPDVDVDLPALHEEMRGERSKELHELALSSARTAAVAAPRVLLREGVDYIEVIRQVLEGGHDLVAKASDNNSGLSGVLFGTLDMQLLRKCPCPVFIIKARKKIAHARILAALDLDQSDRKRSALNQELVATAAAMAGIEEGSLDLLHAWHLPYEKKIRNEDLLRNTNTVGVLLKDLRSRKQQQLDKLAAEWLALGVQTHLIKGEAQVVIPRFARSQRIDLVVMGTVGRSGLAGFFIGNTAEKILYGLNCSVLALKPQGFKTPVK
jgi:universal stress protein E